MNPNLLVLIFILFTAWNPAIAQEATNTNSLYDIDKVQKIELTFDADNWQQKLDSLRLNGADMLIGTAKINDETFQNVGVRWKGSRAFAPGMARNGIFIKLNYINRKQNIEDHGSVILSQSLRDPSMIREVLSNEIARKYMPAPRANYAQVFINNKLYGLLVNVEPMDDAFLEKHFGNSEGAYFSATENAGDNEPSGCKNEIYGALEYEENVPCYLNNFEDLNDGGWDQLIDLTKTLNQKPENIEGILDVDRALWFLAFNNLIGNLNGYLGKQSINYQLYQDADGKFIPLSEELNLAFGSYKNTGEGSDLNANEMQELSPFLHINNPYKPLVSKILKNEFYRKLYLSHLRQMMREEFYSGKALERANELQSMIRPFFMQDNSQRYSMDDFDNSMKKIIGKRSKIPGIGQYIEKRTDYLNKHPKLKAVPPPIKEVEVADRDKYSSTKIQDFAIRAKTDKFTKRMKIVYRLGNDQSWTVKDMMDDGNNKDGVAEDGIYGVIITPNDGQTEIEYMIWAENASMISYSPDNYMWEKHEAKLEELNK